MKIDDVEKALENAKYVHLTDSVLISHRDQELDEISRRQADAHLRLCLICQRRLSVFHEERAAVYGKIEAAPPAGIALTDRLAEYLRAAAASLQAYFAQLQPVRGAERGSVVLGRWESEDGVFAAWVTLDTTADLKIHISSSEVGFEGARVKVRAGLLTEEATLERVSETEVGAEVTVPRRKRPRHLKDISIEPA